jgi:hypothetical protein
VGDSAGALALALDFSTVSHIPRRIVMVERRGNSGKELKRDQQIRREVRKEIGSEIAQERTGPAYRNPNRDQARGDWDRSGRHVDEGRSRDTRTDGDDGLRPLPSTEE